MCTLSSAAQALPPHAAKHKDGVFILGFICACCVAKVQAELSNERRCLLDCKQSLHDFHCLPTTYTAHRCISLTCRCRSCIICRCCLLQVRCDGQKGVLHRTTRYSARSLLTHDMNIEATCPDMTMSKARPAADPEISATQNHTYHSGQQGNSCHEFNRACSTSCHKP